MEYMSTHESSPLHTWELISPALSLLNKAKPPSRPPAALLGMLALIWGCIMSNICSLEPRLRQAVIMLIVYQIISKRLPCVVFVGQSCFCLILYLLVFVVRGLKEPMQLSPSSHISESSFAYVFIFKRKWMVSKTHNEVSPQPGPRSVY